MTGTVLSKLMGSGDWTFTGELAIKGAKQAGPADDGRKSSGTYRPTPAGGNIKKIVNGGNFAIVPPTEICTITIQMRNSRSAGRVRVNNFTTTDGLDDLTRTNGHAFLLFITKTPDYSYLFVKPLQDS